MGWDYARTIQKKCIQVKNILCTEKHIIEVPSLYTVQFKTQIIKFDEK